MRYAGADSRHTPGALTAHQIAATHTHSEQFEYILEVDAGSLNGNFDLASTRRAPLSRFKFELYKTDVSDGEMSHGYLVPYPKWESKGVRVKVK